MRTLFPVLAMVAIGLAAFMMSASGFNAMVGLGQDGSAPAAVEVGEDIEGIKNNSTFSGNDSKLEGSAQGSGDSTIVGMVFSGVEEVMNVAGMVVMMPMTLKDMGFPMWFAAPVGSTASIIASIGILQFVTGRIYK